MSKTCRNYLHYKDKEIQGIIYLVSFGCGPDSLTGRTGLEVANKNVINTIYVVT